MKTAIKIALLGTALAAGLGATAFAAGGPEGWRHGGPGPHGGPARMEAFADRMFDRLDADHDGVVTLQEALAVVDKKFDKIDANHDGVIDRAELESWLGRRASAEHIDRILKHFDLNGDGKITKAEAETPMKKRFALFDRNDDGKITKEELHDSLPVGPMLFGLGGMGPMGPHHGPMRHGMMGPEGGPGPEGPGFGGPDAGPMDGSGDL